MPFMRVVRKQSRPLVAHPVRPDATAWHPPAARPKAGLPAKREKRRGGTVVSFLLHFLILLFVISPAAVLTDPNLKEELLGAGGAGPAGGGGGGNMGTGSVKYVKVAEAPKPAPPKPTVQEVIPPKVAEPVIAQLELPKLEPTHVEVKVATPVIGIGGGTGKDGSNGNGPGSGGGVGAGIGTGRGSGVGPGTGGGADSVYPPLPKELPLPPLPAPASAKCSHVVAQFDVDERGKVLSLHFTPTKDGGYNRRLQDVFTEVKWRPGTTLTGTPIRAKGQIVLDLGC